MEKHFKRFTVVAAGVTGVVLGSLLLFVGLQALVRTLAFEPAPAPLAQTAAAPPIDYLTQPAAASKHISQIAAQTQGDWSRVSAADQQLLDSLTAGHGREMLQMTARKQQQRKGAN